MLRTVFLFYFLPCYSVLIIPIRIASCTTLLIHTLHQNTFIRIKSNVLPIFTFLSSEELFWAVLLKTLFSSTCLFLFGNLLVSWFLPWFCILTVLWLHQPSSSVFYIFSLFLLGRFFLISCSLLTNAQFFLHLALPAFTSFQCVFSTMALLLHQFLFSTVEYSTQ